MSGTARASERENECPGRHRLLSVVVACCPSLCCVSLSLSLIHMATHSNPPTPPTPSTTSTTPPPPHLPSPCKYPISRYYDAVPDEFLCPQCRNPFVDAVLCPGCGTSFCRACLQQAISLTGSCPHASCHSLVGVAQLVPIRAINDHVKSLRVFCANRADGCAWFGERLLAEHHESECDYRSLACRHCQLLSKQRFLAAHETTCSHREIACSKGCGARFEARTLATHLELFCPLRSLDATYQHFERKLELVMGVVERLSPTLSNEIRVQLQHDDARIRAEEAVERDRRVRVSDAWRDELYAERAVVLSFGSQGADDGQFNEPIGVCCYGDRFIVCDYSNHRVQVFASDGHFVAKFGAPGSGEAQLDHPQGVACDQYGRIVVADSNNHRIQIFAPDGRFVSKFGSQGAADGQFNQPWRVACDQLGRIIVSDFANHRVQVFSNDGRFLFKFGSKGSRDGQFEYPCGIAVDEQLGRIIVSDINNHRVQVFSSNDGSFLFKFGEKGQGDGMFESPRAIAVDRRHRLIVCDRNNHNIQIFTSDGIFLAKFGARGAGQGRFKSPCSVAIDPTRRHLVITEQNNHRVQVVAVDEELLENLTRERAPTLSTAASSYRNTSD